MHLRLLFHLLEVWNRHCLCLPVPSVYCSVVLLCKCKCVCLTASLLSSRHIHRSAAHSPGAHPEAVWVSERAGVGACCVLLCCSLSLCRTSLGCYLFGKHGPWKVHVSFCVRTQFRESPISITEFRSSVRAGRDVSHICANGRAFQR